MVNYIMVHLHVYTCNMLLLMLELSKGHLEQTVTGSYLHTWGTLNYVDKDFGDSLNVCAFNCQSSHIHKVMDNLHVQYYKH